MSKKRTAKMAPIIAGATYEQVWMLYDRVMYHGAPVLSCESRRFLQKSIDGTSYKKGKINLEAFENLVSALSVEPNKKLLLSEIAMMWFLKEYPAMTKSRKTDDMTEG